MILNDNWHEKPTVKITFYRYFSQKKTWPHLTGLHNSSQHNLEQPKLDL